MKANEFIKKYGIAEAKALVKAQSWTMRQMALSTTVDTKELTRLVESHELVESEGGLLNAKNSFQMERDCGGVDMTPFGKKLYQAIADVESCNVD